MHEDHSFYSYKYPFSMAYEVNQGIIHWTWHCNSDSYTKDSQNL